MAKSGREDVTAPALSRIGPTLRLKGELKGDEDLVIEGDVTGVVSPGNRSITIGRGARVSGEVSGRVITVEGSVDGKLAAQDIVNVLGNATVSGEVSGSEIHLDDEAQLDDVLLSGKMGRPVRF